MTSNSEARTGAGIRGVGAAAPALRVQAADIGAAWGRSGRGHLAACAPDEDTLTLAWDAASAALAAAGVEADAVEAIYWGTSRPPFAEGPSLAFLAAALGLSRTAAAHSSRGPPTRAWRRWAPAPTPWPRAPLASCSSSSPTLSGPGSARGSRPAAARARRRSCCRPTARPRSRRASPTRAPSSIDTAATVRPTTAISTTRGSSAKRSSCRASKASPRALAPITGTSVVAPRSRRPPRRRGREEGRGRLARLVRGLRRGRRYRSRRSPARRARRPRHAGHRSP